MEYETTYYIRIRNSLPHNLLTLNPFHIRQRTSQRMGDNT